MCVENWKKETNCDVLWVWRKATKSHQANKMSKYVTEQDYR